MTGETETYRSPYAPYPGSSTPAPEVDPKEGKGDLWTFFWLSLLSTLVIAVTGIATWWFVHHG